MFTTLRFIQDAYTYMCVYIIYRHVRSICLYIYFGDMGHLSHYYAARCVLFAENQSQILTTIAALSTARPRVYT